MGAISDGHLKKLLRKNFCDDRKIDPFDEKTWLRVSGLAGLCAREEALRVRLGVVRDDVVDANLGLIFEHGHALHWVMQNKILPELGVLYGRWLCGCCGSYFGGADEWMLPLSGDFFDSQILRPQRCVVCGVSMTHENSLYKEQWIKDPTHRIAGHPDGFLRLDGMDGMGILEIKSINSRGARDVRNCAKLDHVTQLQCYMWMVVARWGKILYWDKGTVGLRGLIEHVVEYDDDHVGVIRKHICDVWDGIEGGKLPDPICVSSDCKRARACSVVDSCFGVAL